MIDGRPCILSLLPSGDAGHPLLGRLPALGRVFHRDRLDEAELARIGPQADVLVGASNLKVGRAELEPCPNLKIVADNGVGFDGYDLEEINRRGLFCTHTPDVLSEDTADLAMALLLAVTRRVAQGDAFVRAGRWPRENFPLGVRLFGRRVGVAGLGRIGGVVARRAAGFGCEVGYVARTKKDVPWERFESVEALARWCDFLVVVIPGSPETKHLIDAKVLDALGPGGYLINIARGALVDTAALVAALREGRIAGAGLDVFEHEPHVEPELIALENVVLMPHQGSATTETRDAMAELVVENIRQVLAGEPPATPVPGTKRA